MINYILFDDQKTWKQLLPLTFTRPISEIRIGILKIKEKWDQFLNSDCSYLTEVYLRDKFKFISGADNIFINSALLPDLELKDNIISLKNNQALYKDSMLLAVRLEKEKALSFNADLSQGCEKRQWAKDILSISFPWDIFGINEKAIIIDFELITKGRKSVPLSKTNNVIRAENIFMETGASVEFATLNASKGPIYIAKNAEIMEGSLVRGPFALGEGSVLKLGAKIYGATTVGPHSKMGGELNNSVIFGYSNKAHDGFLGNSVLGEWCNIGADSNNSNLKNNYAEVKMWSYIKEGFIPTGLQFCGLIMGDHSKCGINTMFNTGTVVGVSANIFGAGYPRNFIPSFSWGGASGLTVFSLNKAFEVAERVMSRRHIPFDEKEMKILENVFNNTIAYRHF
jgi:UDP-N-acetylglucosamine diphosphorylase/glucosamine-1-phosphate N-acetyltransferase